MLTITRSARSCACATRATCPLCRFPMVGTNATLSLRWRQAATRSRNVCIRVTDSIAALRGPVDAGRSEAVLGCGVAAILHSLDEALHRGSRAGAAFTEIAREARLAARGDVEDVVEHEDLSVDVRSRADADHRHVHFARDARAELRRNAFEQHDVRAGAFQRLGV